MNKISINDFAKLFGLSQEEKIMMMNQGNALETTISKDDFIVPSYQLGDKKIQLHSKYSVLREAEIVHESFYQEEAKEYYFAGFGFGYHIMKFLKQEVRLNILIVNLEVFFQAYLHGLVDPFLENDHVKFYYAINQDQQQAFLNRLSDHYPEAIYMLHLPSLEIGYQVIPNHTVPLKAMQEQLDGLEKMRPLLFANAKENIALSEGNGRELLPLLKDEMVFVVASGPSLDQDVEMIKKFKDKAKVVAVSSAIKILARHGITPDLGVFADPNAHNIKHIDGIDQTFPILQVNGATPEIAKVWTKEVYYAHSKALGDYKKPGDIVIEVGASVIVSAIDIALKAKPKGIILCGQDLSFPLNKTHAEGSAFQKEATEEEHLFYTVDYDGNKVGTHMGFEIFRRQIETLLREHGQEVPIYNITRHGAVLHETIRKAYDELDDLFA